MARRFFTPTRKGMRAGDPGFAPRILVCDLLLILGLGFHPTTRKKTRVPPSQIAQKRRAPGTLMPGTLGLGHAWVTQG